MATYNGHFEDASGNILLPMPSGAVATIETTNKASQAYTSGSLLYFNNRLCRATTAIASGNTLAVGTNLSYTTIGAETSGHLVASNGTEFTLQNLIDGAYS